MTLEDFSGQAMLTVFPATYQKFYDFLVRDSVVKVNGTVMHRERQNGDKTVEIRLEEIEPLDGAMNFSGHASEAAPGVVSVVLNKATAVELERLKNVLASHKGDYEVFLQILPRENHLPLFVPYTVAPHNGFAAAVKEAISTAKVEISGLSVEDDGE
jgi:DNA polymerase III alpha subunit